MFKDPRDGNFYRTVRLGNNTWMAENLRYIVKPYFTGWGWASIYVYNHLGGKLEQITACNEYKKYGCLYSWPRAISICPDGWRLPNDEDWKMLINYLGGENLAVGKMINLDDWKFHNVKATNESGFSGLPGGCFRQPTYFSGIGSIGSWYSSSEYSKKMANVWTITNAEEYHIIELCIDAKDEGRSVRYVKM
jgi:uncharacterized protein (TIGR02145 family)